MTVKIKTPLGEATCDGEVWTADDKEFEEYLNLMHEALHPHGMGGEYPDKDYACAQDVINELGKDAVKIIYHEPVKSVPGRIY